MRIHSAIALAAFLLLTLITGLAQDPGRPNPASQTTPTPTTQDDDVVRITTNLIQLDVTVTDKDGNLVPDLKADDFEILENNKTQKISNFSYVSVTPTASVSPAVPANPVAPAKNAPPTPPVSVAPVRPEQVRRTFALVVDDLGLSFESLGLVRRALRSFIDKTMQPGDLVAILRTRSGEGTFQQFTTDKRHLIAAIERIRWTPMGRGGMSAFAPPLTADSTDEGAGSTEDASIDLLREQNSVVGTLGAVRHVINGLRDMPGRKSLVLFSDGLSLLAPPNGEGVSTNEIGRSLPATGDNARARELLRKLTDLANRASVVIYTMDARGVANTDISASDDPSTLGPNIQARNAIRSRRSAMLFHTQTALIELAAKTGGLAIRNENDLPAGMGRIAADQNGYYLIGYQPDENTFDARRLRYNDIKIKLKRPGLKIRYRAGFYGVSDDRTREKPALTPVQTMLAALASPFKVAENQLQLTTIFGNDAGAGSYMRAFLHIRAQDLTFTEEADGARKAEFDLIAVTVGADGAAVDSISKTFTMRLRGERYEQALKEGIIYTATVPIKKAGSYQLRVAVRDTTSNRIGSASQFIEVPDIENDRLTLSGLAAFGQKPEDANRPSPEEDPEAGATTRRLRKGMVLQYGCFIYNARLASTSKRPQLTTQIRLFRDGKEVFAGAVLSYNGPYGLDMRRLPLTGALELGNMPPGEYVLQIVVTDPLASEKNRIATQWIDFEIVS